MIICDRCQSPAVDKIVFEMDDQRFDLCASCRQVVLEVVTSKPAPERPAEADELPSERKKGGRPKRNG